MSDDFKKQPPNQPPDDDELLDWLRGPKDDSGKSGSGSFGFTGELQWKQGAAGDSPDAPADDELFDWQQSPSSQQSGRPDLFSASTGLTGELDWRKADAGDADNAQEDPLAWMKDFALDPEPAPAPSAADAPKTGPVSGEDPLTWMKAFDVHIAQTSQLDPRKAPNADPSSKDPMSWLEKKYPSDPPLPPPVAPAKAGEDPLAWMKDFELEDHSEAPQDAAPQWLAGAEDDLALVSDDLPSWLAGEEGPAAPPTDEDLLGGLDDALGIIAPPPTKPDRLSTTDVSLDWMAEAKDANPVIPTPGAESGDMELPDWWDDVGTEPGADLGEIGVSPFPEEFLSDVQGVSVTSTSTSETETVPPGDIFAQLGLPSVETGYEFADQPPAAEESPQWFAEDEPPPPASVTSKPDWLTSLEDMSNIPAAQRPQPAEDQFLAELRAEQPAPSAVDMSEFEDFSARGLQDIDQLLASYDTAPLPKGADTSGVMGTAELDKLLSESELAQINSLRSSERSGPPEGLSPDAPEWLTELSTKKGSVGGSSAAAILRKQADQERPVEELSDRLYALREAGLEMQPEPEDSASPIIANLLPGVNELIPLSPLHPGMPGITGTFALEASQQKKLDILKTLVAIEDEKPQTTLPTAIDLTLAHPNMDEFVDDGEDVQIPVKDTAKAAKPKKVKAPRAGYRFDRLLLALLLTAAVVLPFIVPDLRIGELPPAYFATGSMAGAAYDRVEALTSGQVALVAIEYGPGAAGELDPALDALLRHILLQGVRPALIGGNAVGLLHARNVLEQITADAGFRARLGRDTLQTNRDYYVLRYLPGAALGLRSFAQDVSVWSATDVNGDATGLHVTSLKDFALVSVLVEHVEDARVWVEQIAPLAATLPIMVVGQSAAPLVQPYAAAGGSLGGLLIGYRDAFTYQSLLDVAMGLATAVPTETVVVTIAPTDAPPTVAPTEAVAVAPIEAGTEATTESGTPATTEATVEATTEAQSQNQATSAPTDVPTEAATLAPTDVPPTAVPTAVPTEAPTLVPTAVPTEAVTLTPTTEAVQMFAVVVADDAVRVREGAGRNFAPIETLKPGERVQVIGRTGDSAWIQVRLTDGREGWVSASLLRLETPATPTTSAYRIDPYAVAGLDSDTFMLPPLQEATPEVTTEPVAEVTAEATPEVNATDSAPTPPPAPTPVPLPQSGLPDREVRWYGMTLGLIAVIAIIALGAVINILRSLFRRASRER